MVERHYGSLDNSLKVNQECNSIEENKPVVYWDGKCFASKDKSSLAEIPLYTHPVKELTQNITGVWRLSDQSIQIVFTSCRSASEFVEILRKANEK